jgi:hypothetical protein
LVEAFRKRLGSWGNKYISLGGRIVLINAMLNAIPIFFLSYMRMPVKVWREVVSIQRKFFWGGLSNKRKMCWVKWGEICKSKKDGGLGIKDLRLMNKSLLAKWRWKLLSEGDELWKKVLVARHGGTILGKANLVVEDYKAEASVWWKDICRVDEGLGWFSRAATKVLGNGNNTLFWKDVWVGGQCLQTRFPRLFGISTNKDLMVNAAGRWENGVWRWNLVWRRNFFVWEEMLYQELLEVVAGVNIHNVEDGWSWNPGGSEGFSVKSTYVFLKSTLFNIVPRSPLESFVFNFIWKSGVPSKVCALAWQVLLDKIPSRENLYRRRVISVEEVWYPCCGSGVESTKHLFLHCKVAASIWYAITRWFGVVAVLPPSLPMSFAILVGYGSNKRRRKGLAIIWLAFIWAVWLIRNNKVFNNIECDVAVFVIFSLFLVSAAVALFVLLLLYWPFLYSLYHLVPFKKKAR